MAKKDFGTCTGKCTVCTINLWEATNGKPAVFPCNIEGCPYEDPKSQHRHIGFGMYSLTGSGLGQV